MPVEFRNYDGTPSYVKGMAAPPKRDGLKKTLRATVKVFRDLGNKALNAADYERTLHLPVGGGRLACDELGEFDEDAPRPTYDSKKFGAYPMHVHSTITEGEYIVVKSDEERDQAIASRKWSLKPLEKKKRFTLTAEDTLVNLQAQLHGERAGRLDMERRLEAAITGGNPEVGTMLAQELAAEKQARKDLETRFEMLLKRMEDTAQSAERPENPETEGEAAKPVSRGRRTVVSDAA